MTVCQHARESLKKKPNQLVVLSLGHSKIRLSFHNYSYHKSFNAFILYVSDQKLRVFLRYVHDIALIAPVKQKS